MLSKAERARLKALAHSQGPVLWVGQKGVTDALLQEMNQALDAHELIKVKILSAERDERAAIRDELIAKTHSELIGAVGKIIIVFRKKPE